MPREPNTETSENASLLPINSDAAEPRTISYAAKIKPAIKPGLSALTGVASALPYGIIIRNAPLLNIISTVSANFLVNTYAANASLQYLQKLSEENKKKLAGALLFAMLTSLPITFIGYDESKQPTEKIITTIATLLGTSVLNLLSLSTIVNFYEENFTAAGKARNASEREKELNQLYAKQGGEARVPHQISSPTLIAGKISEYTLKIISTSAITFCALILTAATEKSLRDSVHLPDSAAFSAACALMIPTILLCAITGWNAGNTVTRHIANIYQTGHTTFQNDKKAIIAATFSGAMLASLSGSAIKKLQASDAPASLMHILINFFGANIAAVISATLFNIYYSALALLKTYQFVVERCCKTSQEEINDAAPRISV